ncbi:MAG: OB-fold domain-containing protein [Nitrososphaerota archaeon]|nr:OB-fold domain-containing protein [Nitrososphaerota archaeon]MDG6939365.1 OB-fold domain-containing protein [Nitrososphaerota archaeon]
MKLKEISDGYFAGFGRGELPYLRCGGCGHAFYYPRNLCPKCSSGELALAASSGKGKVFSCTRIKTRDPARSPIYAIVELPEGFRMYTNVLADSAEIGDDVEVVFREVEGRIFPFFRPAGDAAP